MYRMPGTEIQGRNKKSIPEIDAVVGTTAAGDIGIR